MPTDALPARAQKLLDDAGIRETPTDVHALARHLGAEIQYAKLASNISGFLYRKQTDNLIVVNSRHHENRQRFTIAHEIAHLALQHDTGEVHVDKGVILYRDEDTASTTVEQEVHANAFAAELLMPRKALKRDLSDLDAFELITEDHLDTLCQRYGVSMAALINHLQNLDVLKSRYIRPVSDHTTE